MKRLQNALTDIESTSDLLEKALKLAGLVTDLFKKAGWELVVVGGSSVEFYTEGAYMSGDVDFCRRTLKPIPLRTAQEVMGQIGGSGGPRSWVVAGLYVDLLGLAENESAAPYRKIVTPYGPISILPVELALVERILPAFYPRTDPEALGVARKLMAVCLKGAVEVDWKEVERLAALPAFNILTEYRRFRKEMAREINVQT